MFDFGEDIELKNHQNDNNFIKTKDHKTYIILNQNTNYSDRIYYLAYALGKVYLAQQINSIRFNNSKKLSEVLNPETAINWTNINNANDNLIRKFADNLLAPKYIIDNIENYFKKHKRKNIDVTNKFLANMFWVPIAVIRRQKYAW